jgi:hypothetical protein
VTTSADWPGLRRPEGRYGPPARRRYRRVGWVAFAAVAAAVLGWFLSVALPASTQLTVSAISLRPAGPHRTGILLSVRKVVADRASCRLDVYAASGRQVGSRTVIFTAGGRGEYQVWAYVRTSSRGASGDVVDCADLGRRR